jgi:hypothetical protein
MSPPFRLRQGYGGHGLFIDPPKLQRRRAVTRLAPRDTFP